MLAAVLYGVAHAQPGTLDTSFGTGGQTLISLGSPFDMLYDLAIQPDDKIVVAGIIGAQGGGAYQDAMIMRFTADGQVDSTFGTNGVVIWTGTGGLDVLRGVDIDADGKVVVAGETQLTGGEWQMVILRLLPDGTLDPSFSGDGVLTRGTSVYNSGSYGRDVRCLPDGSILVCGYEHYTLTQPNYDAVSLWKSSATGGIDPNFGGGSSATFTDLFQDDQSDMGNSMVVLADNSIVVGGTSKNAPDQQLGFSTFNSNGSHLGNNDEFVYAPTTGNDVGNAIVRLPDGRYVLAGGAGFQGVLMGVQPNGVPDPGFGTAGRVDVEFGSSLTRVYAALLDPWDKVLVSGSYFDGTSGYFFLGRYTSTGALDGTFGAGGVATHQFNGFGGDGQAIGLQSDGRIVVGGHTSAGNGYDLFLLRFTNDVATGLPAATHAPAVYAYPSPFTRGFTVEGTAAGEELVLLDALGRRVLSVPTATGRTAVEADLPRGMYSVLVGPGIQAPATLRVVRQ